MEGGGGGGVRVGGLMGLERVVDGKSGVFTEVGSGQPGRNMLRGWGLDSEGVRSLSVSSFTSV